MRVGCGALFDIGDVNCSKWTVRIKDGLDAVACLQVTSSVNPGYSLGHLAMHGPIGDYAFGNSMQILLLKT